MNKRELLLGILLLPLMLTNVSLNADEEDYWQQFVHYTMNVTLDPTEHMLTGDETVVYQNNSSDTLYKFYLHLYPNAFRDNSSTYAQERLKQYRPVRIALENRGWIDIKEFKIILGDSILANQEIKAYRIDDTILEASLPKPLPPSGEMTIKLTFDEKVRKSWGRAGYRNNQYDFAQWYPKVVVYDEKGWHPEPFHTVGEFYGEFGTFDITVNIPMNYVIGATGVIVEGDPGWNLVAVDTSLSDEEWKDTHEEIKERLKELAKDSTSMRTVTFHAENVHDFAWSACPDFVYERGNWEGIPVHVLYRSNTKDRWGKVVVERGERALEWLSTNFGRYPYPQLTIIHGLLGGGMEYPMLVMNSSESEGLILHEVGHIYFYGILANNEHDEAWLDEGFTTYQTRMYLENRYGALGMDRETFLRNLPWFVKKYYPLGSSKDNYINWALEYMNSGFNEPISVPATKYKDLGSYGINAYNKGAFFVEMLSYVVGQEKWEKICHEYFERWKFKHVNEVRFKEVCEDVSGMELDWYFDQWLHDTVLIDYQLDSVQKKQLPDGSYETIVNIQRRERGIMPVEVQLDTQDGATSLQRWDGFAERDQLRFVTQTKVTSVVLDPNDQIMDNNRMNNGSLKIKVMLDCPFLYYTMQSPPRNVYLLKWRPSMWYNDVDGMRLGLGMRGSYVNSLRKLSIGIWYGFNSNQVDGLWQYGNPLRWLGPRVEYTLKGQKIEGRVEGDFKISWDWRKHRYMPPLHSFSLGVNYSDVIENDYTFRKVISNGIVYSYPTWEDVSLGKIYLTYSVDPRGLYWYSTFNARIETAQQLPDSDFRFSKLSAQATFRTPWHIIGVHLRGFAGTTFGDRPPLQELFWADGSSPRERYTRFYLRSSGALPPELHFHAPGGGSLRGYFNMPITGEQIVAMNVELRKDFRLPIPFIRKLLGRSRLVGFFDTGKIWEQDNVSQTLSDAGIGLRMTHRFFRERFTIRIDFPLWLSSPNYYENGATKDKLDFRWVVGISEVF